MKKHLIAIILILIISIFPYVWVEGIPTTGSKLAEFGSYSGGSIAVLLTIYSIILSLRKKRKPVEEAEQPTINEKELISLVDKPNLSLTVKSIIDDIHSATPFQRKSVEESYVGQSVKLIGYLYKIEGDFSDKTKYRVQLKTKAESFVGYNIWFSIDLNKFPILRIPEYCDP